MIEARTDHRPGAGSHELNAAALARISALARREAGLDIAPGKSAMVRTRLSRRLRLLGLPDFDAYCDLVSGADGKAELAAMISALTTNVSHFFREQHHFDILREETIAALADAAQTGGRVRIWSAGCANGQEPYSIAMTLLEAGISPDADVRVLATDIDAAVVSHARLGRYPQAMAENIPEHLRAAYFDPGDSPTEPFWTAGPALRRLTRFRVLNLLDDWPMRGAFDAIFCRNVVIYFDAPTQERLWPRFAAALRADGWLFLGHSERLSASARPFFENRGVTAYRRSGVPVSAAAPIKPT